MTFVRFLSTTAHRLHKKNSVSILLVFCLVTRRPISQLYNNKYWTIKANKSPFEGTNVSSSPSFIVWGFTVDNCSKTHNRLFTGSIARVRGAHGRGGKRWIKVKCAATLLHSRRGCSGTPVAFRVLRQSRRMRDEKRGKKNRHRRLGKHRACCGREATGKTTLP